MRFLIANSLTIGRLILGLLFPLLPSAWKLPSMVVGALSDLFDGALSRQFHATSEFGKVLDPIADKIFVLGVVASLVWDGQIALWQIVSIALRDIAVVVVGGTVILLRGRKSLATMSPTITGKVTTALQFILLIQVAYAGSPNLWLFTATVIVSGIAAIDYTRVLLANSRKSIE